MSARERVYVDACVLILAASASEEDVAQRALQELDRPDVEYVFSTLIEHEILPNPIRNKRHEQVAFFQAYIGHAMKVACDEAQQVAALEMRINCPGLELVDALHLSAAHDAGAVEFVTAEKLTKPMVASPPSFANGMTVRTIRV
ncbi:type II toxin-antitoxin system VapC family toxin [Stenotrophomonas sp. S41]|uniref:type II toxin-antitoxin system VapC family toxin n=1 Tax=Stenotrophomonas sp. S41 TaxID=2767464 RepID=UPI00190B41B8|nr:type II toxin-antitoxin system VapC family toxin [Stenotrophomonas sp. S41]MBK0011093.1 type II toxin-antitoxin system VapC family toxin [Stenotrophomonas sp. S41]